uniref:Putative chymotrypsin-like protein n=1 Tax=Aedes aegypti TaxID=7159 RepID=Q9BIG0_AEDAE|nr:putative chymotrypsin-like protein [Aedes aegypti]
MAFKLTVAFLLVASLALASSRATHKIVGGDEAEAHEFPYQISLQWNFNDGQTETMHFCGASVLNENFVLTAAHCKTAYSNTGFIEVVAAEHDVAVAEGSEQRRLVAEFIVHEDYQGGVSPDDIAVIRVDKPFELNDKVKAVKLPKQLEQFDGDVTLSGWGSVSTTVFPDYPDKLRKVVLPLVDYEQCNALWDNDSALAKSNVCAGPIDGSKSACSADSGGPLVKQSGEEVIQVGVVSWGAVPCGSPRRPTVFAGVSHYVDWIEQQLRA